MTLELFREDGYLTSCEATVTRIDKDANGFSADRTVFYPAGGGQPGDCGIVMFQDGTELQILDTRNVPDSGEILHLLDAGSQQPETGERVQLKIDWERRHRLMRMHSCMHLLCSVVPAGVTGGSVRDGSARLDFDLPEPPDKKQIETALNRLIEENHPMNLQWISDEELRQQPELVRTMSVKPPMGKGKVRLVHFQGVDMQPCGGTHVASTAEIGPVRVKKIEKKGRHNRRITVVFAEH